MNISSISAYEKKFKDRIFLPTVIECPNCKNLIEDLLDDLFEVIWDGGEVICDKCGKTIIVKLEIKNE